MYEYKIAVLGIETEYLPFKLVGILFYLRGYILPFLIFYIYLKTNRSNFFKLLIILTALLVGALSASRGVTLFYIFPVLVGVLLKKINLKRIVFVGLLVISSYFLTSLTREITYSTSDLSLFDLPYLLLNTKGSLVKEGGVMVTFLNILGTIANRLYGAQDIILAYQHILVDPWKSFIRFSFGNELVNDLAGVVYGLKFLPGRGFGVGMGIIGQFVMIARSNLLLLLVAVIFMSLLTAILNRLLSILFINNKSSKYSQVYYFVLFVFSFNIMQGSISYIYTFIIGSFIINKLFLNNKFKNINKNQHV